MALHHETDLLREALASRPERAISFAASAPKPNGIVYHLGTLTMPSITVNTDATDQARAAALLPVVQMTVPLADLDYMYNGAAGFGLTRIASALPGRELDGTDLAPVAGTGVSGVTFDLDATNTAIAMVKAAAIGLTTEELVSAAVRTGLSLLAGVDPGPIALSGLSRQFLPPLQP